MNGKKCKMLRKNLNVTALWPQHYRVTVFSMSHPLYPAARVVTPIRLALGHPRAGYRAAKRMYKDRVGMRAFIKQHEQRMNA